MRGKGAAARTGEVQRGDGRVSLERGSQLLGPLRADVIVCGTRGAQAVGAARACAARARAVRRKPPSRVQERRVRGKGAAARTGEPQRGDGRVGHERGGQLLGPLRADLIPCGTRGARVVGARGVCSPISVLKSAQCIYSATICAVLAQAQRSLLAVCRCVYSECGIYAMSAAARTAEVHHRAAFADLLQRLSKDGDGRRIHFVSFEWHARP